MSNFILTLDTAPPVIEWAPPDIAVVTEGYQVLYLLDEPGMISAELELEDQRILPMAVSEDRITVDIPEDAPEGAGVIRALLRDSVGNEDAVTLNIQVSGVMPGGTLPRPGRRLGHPPVNPIVRVVSEPSGVHSESSFTTRARVTGGSRTRVRSRYRAPGFRRHVTRTRVYAVTPLDRTLARHAVGAASHLTTRPDEVRKRPEGPNHEDELIVLGLF